MFAATLVEPEGLSALQADWADDLDLQLDWDRVQKSWVISGQILQPGRYDLRLNGKRAGKAVRVSLALPVSPDPWTIWKDLPVDWTGLPYPKDDTDHVRIDAALIMIGASRRGRSHAHKALPRDDDMAVFHDSQSDWHIATVADGAGSAPYSRYGSQVAVETVMTELPLLLRDHLPDPMVEDVEPALSAALGRCMQIAAQAIVGAAQDADHLTQEYSTTLLIGIAKHTPEGWFFASISIGDGLVGLITDDTPLMMTPDSGAFAGQTMFLRPDVVDDIASIAKRIHHRIVPEFKAFMLMTDGVSDPVFASESAAKTSGNWLALLDKITSAGVTTTNPDAHIALLDWLNFKVKGEHDDRSIAIMFAPDPHP